MTLQALLNERNIKYFTEHELRNASSPIPEDKYKNILPTIEIADLMRQELGFPIVINSSYRNEEHNKDVGGSKRSLHKEFNALDLAPADKNNHKLRLMKNWLKEFPNTYYMGIGLKYKSFVHIDTRGLIGRDAPVRF